MLPDVSRDPRRIRGLFAAGLMLALALPLVAAAQTGPPYRWDPSWPAVQGWQFDEFHGQEGLGVCIDQRGRILLSHNTRRPIIIFDRQGNYLETWGRGIIGEAHSIRAAPDGSIWVADRDRQQILKFTPDGTVLATYGEFGKRGNTITRFNEPTDVAFGPNGDIYVSDGYRNSRVVQLTSDLKFVRSWGRKGRAPGQFNIPHSIAVDPDGRVWVADRENRRIQIFTADGQFIQEWRLPEKPGSLFITPDRRIFVANLWAETISLYTFEGALLGTFGGKRRGRPPGAMSQPHMLCVDEDGSVYEGELRGHRWQRWIPTN